MDQTSKQVSGGQGISRVQSVGPSGDQPTRYYISGRQMAVAQRRIIQPGSHIASQRPVNSAHVQGRPQVQRVYTPGSVGSVKLVPSVAIHQESRPRYPRTTDKSRGLRHFSARVCEKVKEKVQTNYNEVADELVTEYFDSLSYPPQSQEKQVYDSKNIRRRVYDALNVLMAMNIIEKEKKEIRWVGLPTSSVAERKRLEEEREKRKERIKQKQDQLRDYIIQLVAYKSLVSRNRELEREHGRPAEQSILYLPFIVINTERKTFIDCAISQDKTEYAMTFNRPFEIHDDIEVLKRLGLCHGLEQKSVPVDKVEDVKACLPPALRAYIDTMVETGEQDSTVEQIETPDVPAEPDHPQSTRFVRPVQQFQSQPSPSGTQRLASSAISRPTQVQRSYVQRPANSISSSTQSASFQVVPNRQPAPRQIYVVQGNTQQSQARYVYRQPQNYTYVQQTPQVVQQDQYVDDAEYQYMEEVETEEDYHHQ